MNILDIGKVLLLTNFIVIRNSFHDIATYVTLLIAGFFLYNLIL